MLKKLFLILNFIVFVPNIFCTAPSPSATKQTIECCCITIFAAAAVATSFVFGWYIQSLTKTMN